ncbi:MAG: fatty acid desaturase [Methylococcales symbiont of Iophon sp. n. MRB-2018]|nr:MAG: fatty acid desaturase [Methylococcales symbiont of Iophon sp. n. MRB-2018]
MFNHLKYLACFYFPCSVLIFLYTGPHSVINAVAWTLPLWLIILADLLSPKINPCNNKKVVSPVFYDAILYALTAIHFLIISLLLIYASQLQWHSINSSVTSIVNLIVLRILVGTTSGSSAIIVAHELIHRPQFYMRLMGRMLLYTVCYEHFVTFHLRSHHLTVATVDDMATARIDESFNDYWKRVFTGHFSCAWSLEMERINIHTSATFFYKIFANTILQGLFVEFILIVLIIINFGWVATFIFLIQALSGVRLLETINYFQHWGLGQGEDRNGLAWVNQSCVSEYALVGLSNHIAHHQNSATPFQSTLYSEQGPIMPYGYFVTNLWVKLNNASFRNVSKQRLEIFFRTQE